MQSYFRGVGYKAMLGLALAGWLFALQGDGWKLLFAPSSIHEQEITQPPQAFSLKKNTIDQRLSVDGIRLGDTEATVRALWGEPLQVESDMCANFAAPSAEGYRYLRYENSRMVVLRDGRVVVVDGRSVGLQGQVETSRRESMRRLGIKETTRTSNQVLSYTINERAHLHYAVREGRVQLVSLSARGS